MVHGPKVVWAVRLLKCYGQCRGQNEPGVVVIETERDLERLKMGSSR